MKLWTYTSLLSGLLLYYIDNTFKDVNKCEDHNITKGDRFYREFWEEHIKT